LGVIASNVSSILAAGTDQLGVNAVEYTATSHGKTATYEWRDVTGQASTSTSGFHASSLSKHFSSDPGTVVFTSSGLGFLAQATPTDPMSAAPKQQAAQPDHSLIQAAIVAAQSGAIVPQSLSVSAALPNLSSTGLAATVTPNQVSSAAFRRSDSTAGGENEGLQNEESLQATPNQTGPSRSPSADGSTEPGMSTVPLQDVPVPPGLWPSLPFDSVPDQTWESLDEMDLKWGTEQSAPLLVPEESTSAAFGPAAAVALAFLLIGDRVPWHRQARSARRPRSLSVSQLPVR
jgi:hypothetical protein